MAQSAQTHDDGSWLQTEAVWERIAKLHPDPEKAMDRLMAMVEQDMAHRHSQDRSARRREWARWGLQVFRVLLGFAALIVVVYAAIRFLEREAVVQGMTILLTGSVPITALFISGRAESGPKIDRQAYVPPQLPGAF